MTTSKAFSIGFTLVCYASSAQVSSTAPAKYTVATSIDLGQAISRLDLSHNHPEKIRRELSDTNTIHLLAGSLGLTMVDLATIQVVPDADRSAINVYQVGRAEKAFRLLGEGLRSYAQAREEGHTETFILAALTNRVPPLSIAEIDLRVLVLNRPFIPASWVRRAASGTRTNLGGQLASMSTTTTIVNGRMQTTSVTNIPKADEVCRWVSYKVRDGEIEWLYTLNFKANGRLDYVDETRRDAKEDDPAFQQVIKEVEEEVEAEMKKNGTFGKFGSVHTLWHLKKETLRARGVEWRSPSELNPNTSYD